jgi:hypothetical protein
VAVSLAARAILYLILLAARLQQAPALLQPEIVQVIRALAPDTSMWTTTV